MTSRAAPRRHARRAWIAAAAIVAGVGLVALAVPRFIDAKAFLDRALARASEATGYALSAEGASIRWSLRGLAARIEGLRAVAPDASQTVTLPRVDAFLKFGPLLRRRVELAGVSLHDADIALHVLPPPRMGAGPPAGAVPPALAVLAVEAWELEGGRLVRTGPADTLVLAGLTGRGTFRLDPASGGGIEGTLSVAEGTWSGLGVTLPLPAPRSTWKASFPADFRRVTLERLSVVSGPARLDLAGEYHEAGGVWSGGLRGSMEAAAWSALRALVPEAKRAPLAPLGDAGTIALPELRVVTDGAANLTTTSGLLRFDGFEGTLPAGPAFHGASGAVAFTTPGTFRVDATATLGGEATRVEIEGTMDPGGTLDARVRTALGAGALGVLARAPVAVDAGRMEVDLRARGRPPFHLANIPWLEGSLSVRDLGGSFGASRFERARGALRLDGHAAALRDAAARVDGADLALDATAEDLRDPFVRFTLEAGRVDLDALGARPAPPAGRANEPPGSGAVAPSARSGSDAPPSPDPAGDSGAAPAPMLIVLPGEGDIRIGALVARGQTLEDVRAHVRLHAEEGLAARLESARLCDGALSGAVTARFDEAGRAWRYRGDVKTSGVTLLALVTRTPLGPRLEGLLGGSLRFDGSYVPGTSPWTGLDARARLDVRDGAFRNVPALLDLAETLGLREASAERWPFRDLTALFRVERGGFVFDTLAVRQSGAAWRLAGRIGFDGAVEGGGTVRLDAARVDLPALVAPIAATVKESDGTIPIDFLIRGPLAAPEVEIDWEALGTRAAARARADQERKIHDALRDAARDSTTIDRLKKLFGGKKG